VRRRRAFIAAVALAAATVAAAIPGVSAAGSLAELHPLNLRTLGNEEGWQPGNSFLLDRDDPGGLSPLDEIAYFVRAPSGERITETKRVLALETATLTPIVPAVPGVYTLEAWYVNATGEGPHVSAELRFDNRQPASARPLPPAPWIRGDAAVLRIEHPADPQPISGIRGYAVSVGRGSAVPPCAGHDRCSVAETDLRAGIAGDTISLGPLSEGTHVASVVAVSRAGMRSALAESVVLRVDATKPELSLPGAPTGWSNGPVQVTAAADDEHSGMAAAGPGGPFTAISVDGGVPRVSRGGSAVATVAGEGVHEVAVHARDAVGNVAGLTDAGARPLAVVRIDEALPSVAFARSQDRSDPELIVAAVGDGLSGPDPRRGSIEVRASGSRQQFKALPTTVSAEKLIARWDSDSHPSGNYEFRATAFDRAGNSATSVLRSDGARMVLPSPLKAQAQIRFGFGGRRLVWHRCSRAGDERRCRREVIEAFGHRPATRRVPFGRGVAVAGRLTSPTGTPLGGQQVDVIETFADGAAAVRRRTTVVSGPDGLFTARLPAGPSRQVEASFAGTRVLGRSRGRSLRLAVLTGVRLGASAGRAAIGGAPVVFSGRIAALEAEIPSLGRPLQMQFRVPGGRWTEFRTVQSDANGRFRFPYSFSDDDSRNVRFLFRAYASAQPGWPYEPAASRPIAVTGY